MLNTGEQTIEYTCISNETGLNGSLTRVYEYEVNLFYNTSTTLY